MCKILGNSLFLGCGHKLHYRVVETGLCGAKRVG